MGVPIFLDRRCLKKFLFYLSVLPTTEKMLSSWTGEQSEEVEIHYDFDFDDSETVVYTGTGPFPGRVFVLRFWRHAKDGVMHLLGYRHQGHWRDPTRCYPDSYVRYYKPQHPSAAAPEDSTAHHRPSPIEQLAYRVPMLEWEPGVWELPTLKGQPAQMVANARRFPRPQSIPKVIRNKPPLNRPLEKTIEFVAMSSHFQKNAGG